MTACSRAALKADLSGAVASGQLRVEYQPVVDLRTGQLLGAWALARRELASPSTTFGTGFSSFG